ncbi:AimR family lysis-lysogeny pheromone receptor [Oceanobacillus senegalensis]|uniref:AimR family lysis-lysogeny pheromone receptor n=1 Tax=Oceanobacillus senegalensis TaxID=1936063 RepID=UPI000A30A061|nr:AimR family lysis-lysogeny pheromone receptor [Oceanobacillus senegalensis]
MRVSTNFISNIDELTMEQLQSMLRLEHDINTVRQLIRKYCIEANSSDLRKKGMEYLYMHGYFDDLEELINKNIQSSDPSMKQWAEVYQILLNIKHGRYAKCEAVEAVKSVETKEPELLCLLEFAMIYKEYSLCQYKELGNFISMYDQYMSEIDDFYLQESFKIRYIQLSLMYTLMRNEIIVARRLAYKLLNQVMNPYILLDTHIKLGLSYTFDSYFKAIYHMHEALKIAKEYDFPSEMNVIEKQYIPFLSAHFGKADQITTTDKTEQAHLELAKGNKEDAIEILTDVAEHTPFSKYYLGKALKDKSLLIQSYKQFVHKRNDYFFSRLPLNELRRIYF